MSTIKGIEYPITKHPQGFFHNTNNVNQVKASMAAIILTEPGDRVFEMNFGTSLSKINLNAPVELVNSEIRMKVASSLKRWEKRVQVTEVQVNLVESQANNALVARIEVFFIDPIDITNVHNLVLHKFIGGLDGGPLPF